MHGPPTGFWAKLDQAEDGTVLSWHPLIDHSADVAACFEAILRRTSLGIRLARIAGTEELTPIQEARLCVLAALHDMGKVNRGFQAKSEPTSVKRAGHIGPLLALFQDTSYEAARRLLEEALPTDRLLEWTAQEEAISSLLVATFCHHGRPYAIDEVAQHDPSLWRTIGDRDPFAEIARLVDAAFTWFPLALESGDEADFLPASPAFQHAYNGLLTLADWLGSDERRFFPYAFEPGENRIEFARERAPAALSWIGLDPTKGRSGLGSTSVTFSSISEYEPYSMQRTVLDLPVPESSSLTILEAETGSGKTEAALARYLTLFQSGAVDGLYFALPTRAAAKQIHGRVLDAMRRAFPDEATRQPVVLAVPGYLQVDKKTGTTVDDQGRPLPDFEVLWDDDPQSKFRYRGWAAERPKRYLAGAVVVGTVDQALLSSLMVNHCHLRATSLLRHLLVVDEIHASDPYMTKILHEVLRFHLTGGGHAFFMSATLGSAARIRYQTTFATSDEGIESLEEALARPYPCVDHREKQGVEIFESPEDDQPSKRIKVDLEPWIAEPSRIAEVALGAARRGAKVLVLRNTVSDCLKTQEALEEAADLQNAPPLFCANGNYTPHHSRYTTEDRRLLDTAIASAFGRTRGPDGCVAATTQTVEQSLDIDADLILTDLAPMDVLLQRAGRLHRHIRTDRPQGYDAPRIVVLTPSDRDLGRHLKPNGEPKGGHGLGSVYSDLRVLEATWALLEKHQVVHIPSMNRALVERTTHPHALESIVEELGELWDAHQRHLFGKILAEGKIAALNLVDRSIPFGELRFPGRETSSTIRSRLGADDRVVDFPEGTVGPFGATITTLKVPFHFVRDVLADATAEVVHHDANALEFRLGTVRFMYDRWGLRRATKEEDHG